MGSLKLASAGDDIRLWDCSGFSLVKQFNPHTNHNVSSISWSYDNTVIASSSTGGDKVCLTYTSADGNYDFDIAEGMAPFAEFPTVPLGQDSRTCLAFNTSSRYVMCGGSDGIVHVWDLKTKKLKKSYRDHKGPVTSVQVNWNDSDVASGSETGEIIIFNLVSGQGSTPLTTPRVQAIRQLQYSHFKKSLLGAVSEDGAVNMWDTNRRSLIHSFTDVHKAPATGIAFSPLNEMLVMSVGLDKRIVCYDAQRMQAVKTMDAESPLTSIDLMSDGSTFAVGSTRGKIFIYDLRQGPSPVRTLTAHKSSVQCLAFQHKVKGDVGGAPGKSTGSSRKVNSNNNAAVPAKPQIPKKRVNGVTNSQTDINGVTSQGMDSRNNNRLDTINSNKESTAAEYNTVFSPIRDRISVPRWNSKITPKDRVSYIRAASSPGSVSTVTSRTKLEPDTSADRHPESATNASLTKYGDGIFSPLAEPSSITPRSHYDSALSFHTSPPNLSQSAAYTSTTYTTPTTSHIPTVNRFSVDSPPSTTASTGGYTSSLKVEKPTMSATPQTMGSTDETDFHHSHSDPVISAGSAPMTRLIHPTPEDAGATSLPFELRSKPITSPVTTPPEATAAASLDTPRHRSRSRSGSSQGATGGVGSFQLDMVRGMIDEALEDFRDQIRRDVLNLHMDVLKQFHIQQAEIRTLLQKYSVNDELMAEIERLREENEKLKRKF